MRKATSKLRFILGSAVLVDCFSSLLLLLLLWRGRGRPGEDDGDGPGDGDGVRDCELDGEDTLCCEWGFWCWCWCGANEASIVMVPTSRTLWKKSQKKSLLLFSRQI